MLDLGGLGRVLVLIGLGIAGLGGVIWLLGRVGLPLGGLPGDLRIETSGFTCFLPLASTILLSLILTLLLNLALRIRR
ncbi:MAG: DUF2905 family protein [Anaerolineales bacterium]|jgi:hypothetical protein